MARRGETISELFIGLGLDLTQLESDFIAADRNVNEAMARLRRQTQLINLRAQVELEGLDEATDGARRLAIQEQALNEQMAVQRDRLRITSAALLQLQQTRNQDRAAVQRATIALERERLAMAQLESQMRRLREEQEETTASTGTMSTLMSRMAGPIGAMAAVATSAMATATAAVDKLLERFDELQLKSYELQTSFEKTREYLRQLRFAGADTDDLMGFIRGIDDAIAKGDVDDPETMALKKYGVNLFDNAGRFKEYTEQLELLYEGYKKARAEGEEVNYLLMLNGESIHEILPLFERWEEAQSDASRIIDSGLNLEEMHLASREMTQLAEQTEQFGEALASAVLPGARQALQNLFEVTRSGTEAIRENVGEWREWSLAIGGMIGTVRSALTELDVTGEGVISRVLKTVTKGLLQQNPISDFYGQEWFGDKLDSWALKRESELEQYEEGLNEAAQSTRELEEQSDRLSDVLSYAWRDSITRAKEYREELEDLRFELDFDGDDYSRSMAELEKWLERETRGLHEFTEEQERETAELLANEELSTERRIELTELLANKMKMTEEERVAIQELYAAKVEKIEREREERLEEFAEARKALEETGLQQTLSRIEREKEAWRQKGIEEVEATRWAEETKAEIQRNAALNVLKTQLKEYRAYSEGGFGGLQEYYRNELYRAGIRPEELQMTPTQLQTFDRAKEVATRSLLPNFMSESDVSEVKELEREWLESQRQYVNELRGYAIGDDGKTRYLTSGVPHRYAEEEEDQWKARTESRLVEYYGQNRISESVEGLSIGDKLREQLERDLSKIELPTPEIEVGALDPIELDAPEMTVEALTTVELATPEISVQEPEGIELATPEITVGELEPMELSAPEVTVSPLEAIELEAPEINVTPSEATEPRVLGAVEEYDYEASGLERLMEKLMEFGAPLEEAGTKLAAFLAPLEEYTERITELASRLLEVESRESVRGVGQQALTQAITNQVTTTVNVEEAHAWDSSHIQELAERVAEVLTPVIVGAIGGDSNGY